MLKTFDSLKSARKFIDSKVCVRVKPRTVQIGKMRLRTYSSDLENGKFTNIYDVSYPAHELNALIKIYSPAKWMYEQIAHNNGIKLITAGGYFFTADKFSQEPKQMSFNFSVQDGKLLSLPVVDREALICNKDGNLSAKFIPAKGRLTLNGRRLTWAGSRSDYPADCKVFGSANCNIEYKNHNRVTHLRVLDESSKFTPIIKRGENLVDVGFNYLQDGNFVSGGSNDGGGMNIFNFDFVIRCDKKYINPGRKARLHINTVGPVPMDSKIDSAISIGPMLEHQDFDKHPVNADPSLGEMPPVGSNRIARQVIFKSNGRIHILLFDGSPAIAEFPGVSPYEVLQIIESEHKIDWGCFLDSGRTSRLCVKNDSGNIKTIGNRDYLKWPQNDRDTFKWIPNRGRYVASALTLN